MFQGMIAFYIYSQSKINYSNSNFYHNRLLFLLIIFQTQNTDWCHRETEPYFWEFLSFFFHRVPLAVVYFLVANFHPWKTNETSPLTPCVYKIIPNHFRSSLKLQRVYIYFTSHTFSFLILVIACVPFIYDLMDLKTRSAESSSINNKAEELRVFF